MKKRPRVVKVKSYTTKKGEKKKDTREQSQTE